MKVSVIGSGYVGLVTGACLADLGNQVICMDIDEKKIELLRAGVIPIYEPGLNEVVLRCVADGRLSFTTDPAESAKFGDVQFIAVGTPPGEDGSADLKHVLAAASSIGQHITKHTVIVDKSTVPVGTADRVRAEIEQALLQRGASHAFSVVSNPEFLKEGAALADFQRPDRIVIGSDDATATQVMRELYSPLLRNHDRLLVMDVKSAELTKYAANAMLATRISFMNELALLAEKLGADIEHVRKGIGSDTRIGYHFLYAGCGYGGSCFPKDVKALQQTAMEYGQPLKVLSAVEDANDAQKYVLPDRVKARFGSDLAGKHFAIWGLAFKPNTDDVREATALVVIQELLDAGATVCAYDPVATESVKLVLGHHASISYAKKANEALVKADALIIVTEWKEFQAPDFVQLRQSLKSPVIFDGRNIFTPSAVRAEGFEYYPIGRL
jgi:UDPglucose 6-dehydrogenase